MNYSNEPSLFSEDNYGVIGEQEGRKAAKIIIDLDVPERTWEDLESLSNKGLSKEKEPKIHVDLT